MPEELAYSNSHIQQWFQEMLVHHVPVQHLAIPVDSIVNATVNLDSGRHMEIYRRSYIARLRECMKSQFRVLAYALGEELFEAFADQYLDSHPSSSYTLNDLGKGFAEFLQINRPDAGSSDKEDWPDFMIELSRFEYDLSEVFDTDEGTTQAASDGLDDMELTASPCLRVYRHRFPVCSYYLAFNAGKSPELPFSETSFCAVSRKDYRLGLFPIGADQYLFLKNLLEGLTIHQAKERLASTMEIESSRLEDVWPIWRNNFIKAGFFAVK